MTFKEDNLFYHGTTKDIEQAKKLVKKLPASITSKSGQSIVLDIEMGFEKVNIYPCKGHEIETVHLPTGLSRIVSQASKVEFLTKEKEGYAIYYNPKKDRF